MEFYQNQESVMSGYIIFWTVLIVFCLITFTVLSVKILIRGVPELREMFVMIKMRISAEKKDGRKRGDKGDSD